jgi:predicted nucleotidyltransferase
MVEKITDIKLAIIGLYLGDYRATYHVREMAKLLKRNHTTLLPHLQALEAKDRVLNSKKEGKNKRYSLNLDSFLTRDYLVLAEKRVSIILLEKEFLLQKLAAELSVLNLPGSFVVFGSYAKGIHHKDSDIDLFYLGNLSGIIQAKIKQWGKIYGRRIDVHSVSTPKFQKSLLQNDPLLSEIVHFHISLQNPELFVTEFLKYNKGF